MAVPPALPAGGLAGLKFIDRTFERQLARFSKSPEIAREVDHFLAHAGEANSTEALLADRRLLRVALGAFGLEDQVGKTAFLRKILNDGTIARDALANRLANKAWARFSAAMGFGNLGGALNTQARREEIAEMYRLRAFESAIGEVDADIGLAVRFRSEITQIAAKPTADRAGWFEIMGSTDLRQVVEAAFNLPAGFGRLDIDAQKRVLEDRSEAILGQRGAAVFRDPEAVDRVLTRFLVSASRGGAGAPTTAASTALTLLQTGGFASGARNSLFRSALPS